MAIEFTQYLRPNGRRTTVTIDRPAEIEEQAQAIIAAGMRFEAEVLMNGTVSFSVADAEDDVDIELVANGTGVPEAVDRLVNRVFAHLNDPAERMCPYCEEKIAECGCDED